MNKAEAIDRIMQMTKLAASTTSAGEREAATRQIERLKAQFNLEDREIERAEAIEDAGGPEAHGKLWYFERRIKPHVDVIKDEIDEVLGKIAPQDIQFQVRFLSEFFDAVRALVDANAKDAWLGKPNIQRARNEAIDKAYWEEKGKIQPEAYWDKEQAALVTHQKAVSAVQDMAHYGDLSVATIESIVRIKAKDLEKAYWSKINEEEE